MKRSDFSYELPEELIAQKGIDDRSSARMMVIDRRTSAISHSVFSGIAGFLEQDDVLVVNDTKVFKARITAHKITGGKVEVLLINALSGNKWEALVSHGKRVRQGDRLFFGQNAHGLVEEKKTGARVVLDLSEDAGRVISRYGTVPLPHYIKRPALPEDEGRYQTTYAKHTGSIAAPTAGLHFTQGMFDALRAMGITVAEVTLHIGPGTFKPIRSEHIEEHTMDAEFFDIPDKTIGAIERARRVIAVGTSACRTLETYALTKEKTGWADIFIYPGHRFRIVTGLVTNFHLPCSTPLLLVCAFAGRDLVFRAYEEATRNKYRFLSYGDGMLIL